MGMGLTSCGSKPPEQEPPAIEVTAITLQPACVPAIWSLIGQLQSSNLIEIRARVEGYLETIAYREGGLVQQGDLLFNLDPKPFIAALDTAKGALAKEEALLWRAQQDVERLQPLYEQKAASKKDLDAALSGQHAEEAAVQSAKAQVQQAELNLGYTTITSPIVALAGPSNYRVGALITPGSTSLLTTIYGIDPLWIIFSVSDLDLLQLTGEVSKGLVVEPKNQQYEVEIVLGNGLTYPIKGRVDFANPSFDASTGTLSVRAIIPNPEGALRPGQFVRVRLLGAYRPGALLVPQKSILQGNKGFYVYVVEKNNTVSLRYVEEGPWYDQYWIIRDGLAAGEVVVVDGTNKITAGSRVHVVKMETLPSSLAVPVETPQSKGS